MVSFSEEIRLMEAVCSSHNLASCVGSKKRHMHVGFAYCFVNNLPGVVQRNCVYFVRQSDANFLADIGDLTSILSCNFTWQFNFWK